MHKYIHEQGQQSVTFHDHYTAKGLKKKLTFLACQYIHANLKIV